LLSTLLRKGAGWRGAISLISVVVAAAAIGQTSTGQEILQRAGLSAASSGYTSLSFLHPLSLPQSLTRKRQEVQVSFVIGDHDSASQSYQWSLHLLQQGSAREAGSGQIKLNPEQTETIDKSVSISCGEGRVQIVVELAHPAESIDAWAVCNTREN
jgi:hypothetical protein